MRKILFITVLLLTASCGSQTDSYNIFEANIKLGSLYNQQNVDQFRIKAKVFENSGGIDYGQDIWVDFEPEIIRNFSTQLPSSSDIVGVLLEENSRHNTWTFLGWINEDTIKFETVLSKNK